MELFFIPPYIKILFAPLLLIIFFLSNCQYREEAPHVKHAYIEINKFKNHAFKKYGIVLWGHGGAFREQINEIDLSFYIKKEKSLDEMRGLIVNLTNDFLMQINSNDEIKQYLAESPFPSNRFHLSVALFKNNRNFFKKQKGSKFIMNQKGSKEKKLSLVSLIENEIYYKAANEDEYPMQLIHQETFEEALEKVQSHQPQSTK